MRVGDIGPRPGPGEIPPSSGLTPEEVKKEIAKIDLALALGFITLEQAFDKFKALAEAIAKDPDLSKDAKDNLLMVVGTHLLIVQDKLAEKISGEIDDIMKMQLPFEEKLARLQKIQDRIDQFKLGDKVGPKLHDAIDTLCKDQSAIIQDLINKIINSKDSSFDKYRALFMNTDIKKLIEKLPQEYQTPFWAELDQTKKDLKNAMFQEIKDRASAIINNPEIRPFDKLKKLQDLINEILYTDVRDPDDYDFAHDLLLTAKAAAYEYTKKDGGFDTWIHGDIQDIVNSKMSKDEKKAALLELIAKLNAQTLINPTNLVTEIYRVIDQL